jgi:hypothetical protein
VTSDYDEYRYNEYKQRCEASSRSGATWYKVEAHNQRAGPQNTFHVAMAYRGNGETWAILAYTQLQLFQSDSSGDTSAYVGCLGFGTTCARTVVARTVVNSN